MIGLFESLAFSTSTLLSSTFSFTCATIISFDSISLIFAGMSVNCISFIFVFNISLSVSIVGLSVNSIVLISPTNLVFSVVVTLGWSQS
jgi:hypothetical protein